MRRIAKHNAIQTGRAVGNIYELNLRNPKLTAIDAESMEHMYAQMLHGRVYFQRSFTASIVYSKEQKNA